ncbi:hypothetical protein VTN96DRAFT_5331 [Rasamsonia emersonii]
MHRLFRPGRWPLPEAVSNTISSSPLGRLFTSSGTFYPSVDDVQQVRKLLQRLGPGLPTEVVDLIVDEAEYWPSVETSLRDAPLFIGKDNDRECLRTPPLCYDVDGQNDGSYRVLPHRGIHPCRKIVFSISSHDQGWGGERGCQGTYKGSYTWFDAYIIPSSNDGQQGQPAHNQQSATNSQEQTNQASQASFQPERPLLPTPSRLQSNLTATRTTQDYCIVWHYKDRIDPESSEAERIEDEQGRGRATLDGRAVREMRVGDAVSLWARARFWGWSNHVEKMSVRVFWAV